MIIRWLQQLQCGFTVSRPLRIPFISSLLPSVSCLDSFRFEVLDIGNRFQSDPFSKWHKHIVNHVLHLMSDRTPVYNALSELLMILFHHTFYHVDPEMGILNYKQKSCQCL